MDTWSMTTGGGLRSSMETINRRFEMFMVMQLPVPPNHIYLPTELYDGWEAELTWERDGTTTITFEAQPGKELYAGQAKGFGCGFGADRHG